MQSLLLLLLRLQIYHCATLSSLRLLVIHFVVVSHHQQPRPLTSHYCYKLAMVCRS